MPGQIKTRSPEQTSETLSSRKRIMELLRLINPKLKARAEIKDLLQDTQDSVNAEDFFAEWGIEPSEQQVAYHEELRTEIDALQESGLSVSEIFGLQAKNAGENRMEYAFSAEYDRRITQGLLKMAHLDKRRKLAGTEKEYEKEKAQKKVRNGSQESEDTIIEKWRKKGYSEEKIAKKLEQRKAILKAEEESSWRDTEVAAIAPSRQEKVRGGKLEVTKQINELVDNNYFDWAGNYLWYVNQMRNSLHESKTLVVTHGLEDVIEEVRDSEVETGKPAFITGDLGSGKTEMALFVGRNWNKEQLKGGDLREKYQETGYKILSRRQMRQSFESMDAAQKTELAAELVRTEKENIEVIKDFSTTEATDYVLNDIELLFKAYQKKLITTQKVVDEDMAVEPILLSGHKEFDPAQFIGGFEIKTQDWDAQKLGQLLQEGYQQIVDNPKIKEELKEEVKKAFASKLSSVSIETEAYLGKLFQAMKYGKCLIIDEINAIPHEVVILLNHYITRKPGNTVIPPVNNLAPFEVSGGFKVVFTGNVPREGQQGYVGRQALDAAFMSRLNLVQMDYLNNSLEDDSLLGNDGKLKFPKQLQDQMASGTLSYEDAKAKYLDTLSNEERALIRHGNKLDKDADKKVAGKENDELYHVLSVFGMPKSLVARLPEEYFAKVYELARCSRILQEAYSGRDIDVKYYGKFGKKPQTFMKKAVPSMRALTTIIKAWQVDGYARELDYYLWKYFVQQQEGEEQRYVYYIYKEMGGFFQDQTFPQDQSKLHEMNLVGRIINNKNLPAQKPVLKTFSQHEMLEALFGPSPQLTAEDQKILEAVETKESDLEELKQALIDKIDEAASAITDYVEEYEEKIMMKYCQGKCGGIYDKKE